MRIRKARSGDVKRCAEIERQLWPHYAKYTSHELRKQVNDRDFIFLICEEKGKTIGFLTAAIELWNNTVFVQRMEVTKEHQRKGVGSMLLKEVERMARKQKRLALRLDTGTLYHYQQDFYKKNGFRITGYIKDFYIGEKNPKDRDAVFMSKRL